MKDASSPKIALVYDRVNTPYGGAEQVVLALHRLFPDAPLFTSVYDPQRASWAGGMDVRPSWVNRWSLLRNHHRSAVMLMPLAFESFVFDDFDIVISIASAEAKGILTKPNQLHLCYLLTPTRYLWSHAEEYQQHWLSGWIRKVAFAYLRWWDAAAAARPDYYIPISELVAERCRRYYHRPTQPVIYPPVELLKIPPVPLSHLDLPFKSGEYYLAVARLVEYKRLDLVIQACQQLNRPLVIIGEGPDFYRLRNLVDPTGQVLFRQSVQPELVVGYYHHARAFLAPAIEDFGIATLEAQLAGKPVIVYQQSGAAELVKDGVTGIILKEQTAAALAKAMQALEAKSWSEDKIKQQVQYLNINAFQSQFKKHVMALWQNQQKE